MQTLQLCTIFCVGTTLGSSSALLLERPQRVKKEKKIVSELKAFDRHLLSLQENTVKLVQGLFSLGFFLAHAS